MVSDFDSNKRLIQGSEMLLKGGKSTKHVTFGDWFGGFDSKMQLNLFSLDFNKWPTLYKVRYMAV